MRNVGVFAFCSSCAGHESVIEELVPEPRQMIAGAGAAAPFHCTFLASVVLCKCCR